MPITINNAPQTTTNGQAKSTSLIPKRIAARDRQACLCCGKPIPKGTVIAQITSPLTGKNSWVHATCVDTDKHGSAGVDTATLARIDHIETRVDTIAFETNEHANGISDLDNEIQRLKGIVKQLQEAQPQVTEIKINNGNQVTTQTLQDELFIEEFETLLKLASIGENIFMAGPTQCGKTHVADQIARALGRPFYFTSCFDEMTAADLFGRLDIVDGMKMEWVDGPFTQAYENGGVFLLDEMDMGNEQVMGALNAALAGDSLSLPKRKSNMIAKRHPDFVCIAAANTWGKGATREYCGRNQLDAATLERFATAMVAIDYNDQLERKLARPEIYSWLKSVREKSRANGVRRNVTTRSMIRFSKQLDAGFTMHEIKDRFFSSWTADEIAKVQ